MKIFFAVDGSPESFAAVRQVGQLISPTKDAAVLYFAPPDVVVRHTLVAKEMRDRALKSIADAVFAEAKRFLPEPLTTTAESVTTLHTPREGIIAEAETCGADLIVVGARGMAGVDRFLLGSVSRAVVHHAHVPVLVCRPAAQRVSKQPLRVLYAYDGTESSHQAALAAAHRLTYPAGTEIVAVTVVDAPPADLPDWVMHGSRSPETEAMIEQWRREMENDRRQAAKRLTELMHQQTGPFAQAEIVVTQGFPAEQILNLVNARRIDLIVVGSGGKGPLFRLFLGSTSEKILTHAPCSVLVAREPQP